MTSPCRIFHTRRGHILALIISVIITILISLFLFVTPANAQDTCEPGQKCSFPLASPGGKCRFNEDLFFTKADRWVIPANGYDYFNFRFAPFTATGGYTDPAGVPGGCVCDVATWINYVLLVNGISTDPTAKYHTAYDIAGVPNDGTQWDKTYFVSIEHNNPKPAPGPNGEASKWDADLRVDNPYDQPLNIRWSLNGNQVTIWIELGDESLSAPDLLEYTAQDSLATDVNLLDFAKNGTNFLSDSARTPSAEIVLIAKYIFGGILLACLLISVFSKKFRQVMFAVFSILATISAIAFFALYILRP